MANVPTFEDALRQALSGLDNDDVRIFYGYFEELKRQARRHLDRRSRTMPGETAVAQSALVSLFCDLALQNVPLTDVDGDGYPMFWPLLLKYVERHCNKWNAYFRTKKRRAAEVPLGAQAGGEGGTDPIDHRASTEDETAFGTACEALYSRLTEEERIILEARLKGESLEQIAQKINRSESTVSNRLKRIRDKLEIA